MKTRGTARERVGVLYLHLHRQSSSAVAPLACVVSCTGTTPLKSASSTGSPILLSRPRAVLCWVGLLLDPLEPALPSACCGMETTKAPSLGRINIDW
jgi:hypothetical protein